MAIELVYETHSTTTDNETGIATGWLEGELSDAGRAQAKVLGERRRDDGLAAVFTSDLERAVETAEIAFAGSDVPVRPDRRLRECNYGELNGGPAAQIERERLVDARRLEGVDLGDWTPVQFSVVALAEPPVVVNGKLRVRERELRRLARTTEVGGEDS